MKKTSITRQCKLFITAALICWAQIMSIPTAKAGEIKLKNLQATYDGKPKWPKASTRPENLAYTCYYRDRSLPAMPSVSETVYLNRPDNLELSYFSTALSGNKMFQVGNVIRPGGVGRELESCETTLVTWARAKDYPELAAQNPEGYLHPVTMAIYRINQAGEIVLLISQTIPVLVPWRPETLPTGEAYPYNGYAFRVSFMFPSSILIPERMLFAVGFSTSNAGEPKMSKRGPWDALNLALYNPKPSIGVDENSNDSYVLYSTGWNSVSWPTLSAPMLRMTAKAPQGETTTPPVNAGVYDVRAVITTVDETAQVRGVFVVRKAKSDIQITDPDHLDTGVSWLTYTDGVPSDLEVAVTYNGASEVPDKPGLYNVEATITDPNHEGSTSAVVRIGDQFSRWIGRAAATSGLAEGARSSGSDPDHDGRSNLLEYAFGSDPALPEPEDAAPSLSITPSGDGGLVLTWQENLNATDVSCILEKTATPAEAGSWTALEPFSPTVVSETENVRVLRITLPAAAEGEHSGFLRLRVSQ
jgi:hypothetical protein